jgi:hypothetical protein
MKPTPECSGNGTKPWPGGTQADKLTTEGKRIALSVLKTQYPSDNS